MAISNRAACQTIGTPNVWKVVGLGLRRKNAGKLKCSSSLVTTRLLIPDAFVYRVRRSMRDAGVDARENWNVTPQGATTRDNFFEPHFFSSLPSTTTIF